MNFLMCSFANHDSLRPRLSLSNTSLCSFKSRTQLTSVVTRGNERNKINLDLEL
jgi:hypothetical protein